MYSRLLKPPKDKSFFLFGPRGTGKSSWVKATFPGAVYVDLLEARLYTELLADPQRVGRLIPAAYDGWVILDEVQRVPALLNEVHRLIEDRKLKFVLTGSSARSLRRKGINLLAGRALTCTMHPLTALELEKDFNLDHSLRFGQMPCAYTEPYPKRYLASYVETCLREEVQQEGLTRNLAAFSRFLEAASFSQGGILNITEVARECAIERKVVENYFSILEDLLIGYRLPIFTKKAKRRLVSHPKFYFFDVGVFRVLRPMGPYDRPEEAEGAAFETLFLQELYAINSYLDLGYKISYWRTSNNMEVDFVLYGNKGLKAFEIKRTNKVNSTMLRGLKAFLKDYPKAQPYFIYGGSRYFSEGNIEIIPIADALKKLPTLLS